MVYECDDPYETVGKYCKSLVFQENVWTNRGAFHITIAIVNPNNGQVMIQVHQEPRGS